MDLLSATDTYFNLLFQHAFDNPLTVLASFFLTMARIIPIIALAPFLGSNHLPRPVKVMFAIAITAIMLPQVIIQLKEPIFVNIQFIGYIIKELFIGVILGFLVAIPFYIAQASGSLIDHIRGSSSLQVTDPTTRSKTGPIGIFYNLVLISIFYAIGGPFYFFTALSSSFALIPIDHLLNPLFFSLKISFWQTIVGLLHHVVSLAIQLGAPSIIGILMAEMFLGIANRLSPRVQIVFLGISLKSFVGLSLLAAAWFFVLKQLGKESLDWIKEMHQTIREIPF